MKLIMESWRSFKNEIRGGDLNVDRYPGSMSPDNEPEGFAELQDKATELVDIATKGEPVTLPNGILTYEDFGDGDGQYFLNGEVFANSYDEAEKMIIDILEPMIMREAEDQ
jgi:hypothetical protein